LESYIIRKGDGKLEGPYSLRVIKAFVVAGKLKAADILITSEGELQLQQHEALRSLWQDKQHDSSDKTNDKTPEELNNANNSASTGQVVFYRGKVLPPGPKPTYAGNFIKHSVVHLLFQLFLAKETGRLHLRNGHDSVDIFIEHGNPTYVVSNDMNTMMGELLIREGVVPRDLANLALDASNEQQKPLGQILLYEHILSAEGIQSILAMQFKKRLFIPFSWKDKTIYRFYRDQITGAQFPFYFNLLELLKIGVLEWMPIAQIRDLIIPHKNRRAVRMIHPKLSIEQLDLSTTDLKLYAFIDQMTPIEDLVDLAVTKGILDEERAYRLFYLLWQLQLLRLDEAILGNRIRTQLDELDLYLEQLKQQTFLERMGLQSGASNEEIRQAYIQLAKKYHTDNLPPGTHPEISQKMSLVFALIVEAYRTLTK
jgi:hypothetical protein